MKKAVFVLLTLALAATAYACAGCGGGGGGSPEQVAETFLRASMDGDANTAYDLLTTADRDEIENQEELVEGFAEGVQGYDIGEATISGDTARVALNIRLTGTERDIAFDMVLSQENGEWKVSLSETEVEIQKAFNQLMQEEEVPQ